MDLYTDEEIIKIIKRMRVYKNLMQGELGERLGVQAAVQLPALKGCISTAFLSITLIFVLTVQPSSLNLALYRLLCDYKKGSRSFYLF